MDIFFKDKEIIPEKTTCHSGGAIGSDQFFEKCCEEYGVNVKAYSYKTNSHKGTHKFEISDEEYNEGIIEVRKANKILNRWGIDKYMNLLARNWSQAKYSDQIFAIGTIIKPRNKNKKGYYNKSKYDVVDGGTGYCVQMAINNLKEVFVFDQTTNKWNRWSYNKMCFLEMEDSPKIKSENFAGIGTRELNEFGEMAIKELFKKSFKN